MRDTLVVASAKDVASMNIRDRMLEAGRFEEVGTFDGHPMHAGGGGHLITISDEPLYRNNIDSEFYSKMGEKPVGVVYLSRHSAQSGLRSLTVHPIGNFSHARYGGYFRQLVHCFPGAMTHALRRLDALAREAGLPHKVSLEVTHHGPYLNTPTFFIEIGSDESAWPDRRAAEVVARVVLGLETACEGGGTVLIGVGGGHYAPRHTEVALRKSVCYGHVLPSHAIPSLGERSLEEMLDYSCEARHVYFHRKAMRAEDVKRLTEFFEGRGIRVVREKDLPDIGEQPREGQGGGADGPAGGPGDAECR